MKYNAGESEEDGEDETTSEDWERAEEEAENKEEKREDDAVPLEASAAKGEVLFEEEEVEFGSR